ASAIAGAASTQMGSGATPQPAIVSTSRDWRRPRPNRRYVVSSYVPLVVATHQAACAANSSTTPTSARRSRLVGNVLHHRAALHHEHHAPDARDVVERIAGDGDEIGV